MVMEAQPSPQCVGREFVRQYYTLLNQAPTHLHRFYNNNSSFVHGGLEAVRRHMDPVIGQKQIHERIQQLNFRDCHAKISQVDAQATLGNGVVVQVSGELSNGGQPMRRFTQTFVLAAQSPKKYYVHNDIFRYQDMFGDEDGENEPGRTDEEDQQVDQERPVVAGDMTPPQNPSLQGGYYGGVSVGTGVAVNGGTHHDEVPVAPAQAPQAIPQQMMPPLYQTIDFHHLPQQPPPQQQTPAAPQQLQSTPQPPPPQLQTQTQPVPSVGNVDQQQISQGQGVLPTTVQDIYQPEPEEEDEEEQEEEPIVVAEEAHEEEDEEAKQNLDSNYPSLDQEIEHQEIAPTTNEPSTYATRLKSGTGVGGSTNANLAISPQGPAKSPSSPPPGRLDSRNDLNMNSGRGQGTRGGPRGGATVRGMSRGNDRSVGQPRPVPSDDGNNFGEDKRRGGGPQQHPDNHQLFLGNLPLNATENDLRELFSKYGSIVDLRIMYKSNNIKGQMGGKLPNYGFIVFDDVNTVQAVLDNRPFFFPSENGVKLNVEEKKTKARGSADVRIGSGDVRGGPRMGPGGTSLRGGNRGGFVPARGIFPHGRGGTSMRPGGPGFNQRSSIPR